MEITPAYQRKVLRSAMMGLGLEGMDIMFLSFALSSIIVSFGISSAEAGLIATVTNLGMLVGGVIFGLLADRYGRVRIFTYTIFLFAIATALTAFATNIYWVYVLRFLAGVGGGGEFGIGMAMVADVYAANKRGRASSMISLGGQAGAVAAALLAALIIPWLGWRVLFVIGILPVFWIYFVRKHLKETPTWLRQHKKDPTQRISIGTLFNSPKTAFTTVALTVMAAVQVAGYYGLMNWLPSILQKELGLSVTGSSLWMISTIAGMCLGMITFGQIMDRLGAKRAYPLFLIAAGISIFVYVYISDSIALLIGGTVVGFFVNGMSAGYGALISNHYPTAIRSTANNVIFNTGRAVGGFSPFIIGYLLEHHSMLIAMTFLAVLYTVSLVMIILLPKRDVSGLD
ncbi:MFS transporter [Zophobihabitans entericus]|uniref:MFS transporter n=1 Tax=Zophobihabitans entericus TaxID=1635327 RepID=A0A6G9IE06_9GAMM|nr:MFS transporter [Zophobihabitans entericus]